MRRAVRCGFAVALLGLLLWSLPLHAEDDIAASREQLGQIEARIRQATEQLEASQLSEQVLRRDLATLNRQEQRLSAQLERQQRRLDELRRDQVAQRRRADELRRASQALQGQVQQRLRALYQWGDSGALQLLFSDAPPAQRAEQYLYMRRMVGADQQLLADYRSRQTELNSAVARLETLQQQQRDTLDRQRESRQTLSRAGELKRQLLTRLERQQTALQGELKELQERAERLAALVKRLESARRQQYTQASGAFETQRGRLAWPAEGPVRVPFGRRRHAELNTWVDSQGVELGLAGPAEVRAVWDGRVIFASPFKGFGNLLIVDHGASYYTVYGQASQLLKSQGEPVRRGEVLARVEPAAGRLYFEVRHHGTPQDPLDWLRPR